MNDARSIFVVIALSLAFFFVRTESEAQAIKVELAGDDERGWELLRDGEPYYVKGVGGDSFIDLAASVGANSLRTWGPENAESILDEAEKNGMTVMLGLWVPHERHGFDYNDEKAVKKMVNGFRGVVEKYKDHPALLVWGVGNEVDLNYSNTKVWYAIQDIAKMIHEIDPNHPTTTVTAGIDAEEVRLVKERCPDIDIYCVNTYGDIEGVPTKIREFGWEGAYMITEWGPNGHWEVPKTPWNAAIEQSSSEKAVTYRERYATYIAKDTQKCIGSYVFLWGQKQEKTATWYGMFTQDGLATEGIDELHKLWKGAVPENSAPQIERIKVGDQDPNATYLISGTLLSAKVKATDADGDNLKYKWEINPESLRPSVGGDAESNINAIPGLIKKRKGNEVSFRVPQMEGAYRLFVYVTDGNGHVATTNLPFFVKPNTSGEQSRFVQLKKRTLDTPLNQQ